MSVCSEQNIEENVEQIIVDKLKQDDVSDSVYVSENKTQCDIVNMNHKCPLTNDMLKKFIENKISNKMKHNNSLSKRFGTSSQLTKEQIECGKTEVVNILNIRPTKNRVLTCSWRTSDIHRIADDSANRNRQKKNYQDTLKNENMSIYHPMNQLKEIEIQNQNQIHIDENSELLLNIKTNIINRIDELLSNTLLKNKGNNNLNSEQTNTKMLKLLNFEDDTFKTVLAIDEEKMSIINSWYDRCKLSIDVEDTSIFIPDKIDSRDSSKILYRNLSCSNKELFVNNYVPEILKLVDIHNRIHNMEKKLDINKESITLKTNVYHFLHPDSKKNTILSDMNINIPSNLDYNEKYKCRDNDGYIVEIDNENSKGIGKINPFESLEVEKINKSFMTDIMPFNYNEDAMFIYQEQSNTYDDSTQFMPNDNLMEPNSDEDANKKLIVVLLNTKFYQTIVIVEPDKLTMETILENYEYGFIKMFSLNNSDIDIKRYIIEKYDAKIFNSVEDINHSLNATSQYISMIEANNKNMIPLINEEKSVKKYLNNCFNLSNDPSKKIKASMLCSYIVDSNMCKLDDKSMSGFRNRLSKYLTDLGLKKKRFNDGYYYYGIESKYDVRNSENPCNIQEVISQRENDNQCFMNMK